MKKAPYLLTVSLLFFLFTSPVFANSLSINEFVVNSETEWVEFYNASDSADFVKNYWLDDDLDFENDGGSAKKLLTNLITTSSTYPYLEIKNFLNNDGDYVVFFDNNGNIIDQYYYDSGPGRDISIGRSPDASGAFSLLVSATKGSANSLPPTNTPVPTLTPANTPTPTKTTNTHTYENKFSKLLFNVFYQHTRSFRHFFTG